MSAEAAFLTRRFSVGAYTCTLTLPRPKPGSVMALAIEWSPTVPSKLTADDLQQYRRERNAALAEVARVLGGPVAVVEA